MTGTAGPAETHVPLGADAGLTRHDESYADVTAVQPVARACLMTRRGLLSAGGMGRLERHLSVYLGI